MKRLIVTADDLGWSPPVSAGIRAACQRGAITSVSVLVTGDDAEEAAHWVRSQATLSVGLHLAFVQGRPCCAPAEVASLLGPDGRFTPSVLRLLVRNPTPDDLAREAEAQYQRFLELVERPPAFVNTHQHAQLLPRVLDVMVDLCASHNIQLVRLPAEQQPLRPTSNRRSWLWPAATAVALAARGKLARAGLRHPDRMIGGPDSGRLTRARLLELIAGLPEGTTELVVHPAEGSPDLGALMDPTVADCLQEYGVERIPFHAL